MAVTEVSTAMPPHSHSLPPPSLPCLWAFPRGSKLSAVSLLPLAGPWSLCWAVVAHIASAPAPRFAQVSLEGLSDTLRKRLPLSHAYPSSVHSLRAPVRVCVRTCELTVCTCVYMYVKSLCTCVYVRVCASMYTHTHALRLLRSEGLRLSLIFISLGILVTPAVLSLIN